MNPALRQQYLEAMGIRSWVPRSPAPVLGEAVAVEAVATPSTMVETPAPVSVETEIPSVSASEAVTPKPQDAPVVSTDAPPAWLEEVPPPHDEYAPSVESLGDDGFALSNEGDGIATLDWDGLRDRVSHCQACGLHQSRSQTVFGGGNPEADVMVIGEAPGADEEREGEPLLGPAGTLLDAMLQAIGFSRDQVYIAGILKCRPPDNRDPHADETQHCEAYLKRQVALVNPKVILAAGRIAAQNLLKSTEPVAQLRGKEASYQDVPVIVSYHPAYLLRSPEHKGRAWTDLQNLARQLRS